MPSSCSCKNASCRFLLSSDSCSPCDCSFRPAMFSSIAARSLRMAARRELNNWFCRLMLAATRGSFFAFSSSGGNATEALPSRSAVRRASEARAVKYCTRDTSACALAWMSFILTSGWPALTASPSRTRISSTRPPVGCWIAFLLVATVTVPLTGTPLSSGASDAHRKKLPTPAITIIQPRRVCTRASVFTSCAAVSR